jgi:hypothetical protein
VNTVVVIEVILRGPLPTEHNSKQKLNGVVSAKSCLQYSTTLCDLHSENKYESEHDILGMLPLIMPVRTRASAAWAHPGHTPWKTRACYEDTIVHTSCSIGMSRMAESAVIQARYVPDLILRDVAQAIHKNRECVDQAFSPKVIDMPPRSCQYDGGRGHDGSLQKKDVVGLIELAGNALRLRVGGAHAG